MGRHPADLTSNDVVIRPERLFAGYIFDLDGTVYLGEALLPGAARLIGRLRELERRVLFVSNNPTSDPARYAAKLTRLGLPTEPSAIINTVFTMTAWLKQHHPDATVYPISEEPLKRALAAAGIRMSEDPRQIDFVIASFDRTLTYEKLQIAFDAIWYEKRARLIATNPDRFCPMPGGHGQPDAAAIIAAIEACTGARCEVNVGKPDPIMLETVLQALDLTAADCVMVGDRLATDIQMALGAGMPAALVLTGETSREMLAAAPPAAHPDFVLERIDQLLPDSWWAAD